MKRGTINVFLMAFVLTIFGCEKQILEKPVDLFSALQYPGSKNCCEQQIFKRWQVIYSIYMGYPPTEYEKYVSKAMGSYGFEQTKETEWLKFIYPNSNGEKLKDIKSYNWKNHDSGKQVITMFEYSTRSELEKRLSLDVTVLYGDDLF